jgi:hypothetical protein
VRGPDASAKTGRTSAGSSTLSGAGRGRVADGDHLRLVLRGGIVGPCRAGTAPRYPCEACSTRPCWSFAGQEGTMRRVRSQYHLHRDGEVHCDGQPNVVKTWLAPGETASDVEAVCLEERTRAFQPLAQIATMLLRDEPEGRCVEVTGEATYTDVSCWGTSLVVDVHNAKSRSQQAAVTFEAAHGRPQPVKTKGPDGVSLGKRLSGDSHLALFFTESPR